MMDVCMAGEASVLVMIPALKYPNTTCLHHCKCVILCDVSLSVLRDPLCLSSPISIVVLSYLVLNHSLL